MTNGNAGQSDNTNSSTNEPSGETTSAMPPSNTADTGVAAATIENAGTSTPKSNWFRRFFWLGDQIAEATAKNFGPTKPGWQEFELARETRTAVEEVKELGESKFAVVLLARSEVLLLLRCHMIRHGLKLPEHAMTEQDWATARTVPLIDNTWNDLPGTHRANVEACFGPLGETFPIGLDSAQRTQLIMALKDVASELIEPLEQDARKIGRIMASRWIRVCAAGAAVLVGLWMFVGWLFDHSGRVNLALNCPVTTSSQYPTAGLDHHLLVDGDRTNMGFHTQNTGPEQWVVIDLGSAKKFDKVVAYNVSGAQDRAAPLRLEVSDDNVNYTKLADRGDVFDVWTAKTLRARGRYVRLRLLRAEYFHLSEVEVY
jgi:hypothetical protein